jgi:sarcosine oxidase subunit gamma
VAEAAITPQPAVDAPPRGVRLAERRLGKIALRGDPADRAFMAAIGRVLDLLLPGEPKAAAGPDGLSVLWLGPDSWLLTCPPDQVASRIESLGAALDGLHAAITDLSDGRVALALSGPNARGLLAKGCPVDLHPSAFPVGSCAQTLLAKASVLIHLVADDPQGGPSFDLYVGRSFAPYLWAWLEDAGREYGVQVTST